jgi:hypothetical protein
MTTPQIKIVNAETGEEVIRDMNEAELEQFEIDQLAIRTKEAANATKAAEKAAVLAKLGLTAKEVAALLS